MRIYSNVEKRDFFCGFTYVDHFCCDKHYFDISQTLDAFDEHTIILRELGST